MTDTNTTKSLLLILKSKPWCFKGCKTYPCDYESNKKAWTTSELSEKWLSKFNFNK